MLQRRAVPSHAPEGQARSRSLFRQLVAPEEPELRPDLLVQASRFLIRASLGLVPTVLVFAAMLWRAAPHRGLMLWVAANLLASCLHIGLHRWRLHYAATRTVDAWLRSYSVTMALGGALGGLLTVVALPGDQHREYQALVAVIVVAFLAANTIFSSPLRRLFLSYHLPLAGTAALGFARHGAPFTSLLAMLTVFATVFSLVLHEQGNSAAVAAVRLTHRNKALVAELHAERRHIELTNEELLAVNEQLLHQAGHDALTDLANRPVFCDHLTRALANARRTGQSTAVLFLDLDRFKLVNDSLGHAVGDQLLIAVGDRVRKCLREGDVLARLGGDEFTVLLGSLPNPAHAVELGERIRRVLRDPFELEHRDVRITVSIGVAVNAHRSDDSNDLLRHADAAMYRAKANGRDRLEIFDDSLRSTLQRRIDEENELRQAFASGQIVSWFQPEVDLQTGRIIGAESLARWIHPSRGVLSAGAFVPIVEDTGLLHDLARVSARMTAAARKNVRDLVSPDFRIRINVSALQLSKPELLTGFLHMLDHVGLDPRGISFEVTETAIIGHIDTAREWLTSARAAGITVALDDFGTGYSSLALLAQLPLDGVKIDLSFVRDITQKVAAQAIVAATVEMASVLDLQVVAEGVETVEQAAALREAGVRRAQGFLYSPAVPIETLRGWLAHDPPWCASHVGLRPTGITSFA